MHGKAKRQISEVEEKKKYLKFFLNKQGKRAVLAEVRGAVELVLRWEKRNWGIVASGKTTEGQNCLLLPGAWKSKEKGEKENTLSVTGREVNSEL